MTEQAEFFAERLRREAGMSAVPPSASSNNAGVDPTSPEAARDLVRRGFQLAFGRDPDEVELTGGVILVVEHGPAALARSLLNANEFLYLR
jgi:hypothetical protein